ncbi:MAG: hypothetical protein ACXWCM_08180 [Acidimicrobiales bacterium]
MKEAALIAMAQAEVPDETVSAAGVFQPRGTEAGGDIGIGGASSTMGHGLAGAAAGAISMAVGQAAGRGLSLAEGIPRWTLMAVTPTKLYAFHVLSPTDGLTFEMKELFRVWPLDAISVHVSGRVGVKVFVVDDHAEGHSYEFEGFRWGWAHANLVMNLFGGEGPRPDHAG